MLKSTGFLTGPSLPARFDFAPPRPNPFRSEVVFDFAVARPAKVSLVVFDIQGRRVDAVVNEVLQPGRYSRAWRGTDQEGRPMPSGVYLVRLSAPGVDLRKKAVLIR